jgi:hypothetical protein
MVHRPAEVEALGVIAAKRPQGRRLSPRLHSLGHGDHLQGAGQSDDVGLGDSLTPRYRLRRLLSLRHDTEREEPGHDPFEPFSAENVHFWHIGRPGISGSPLPGRTGLGLTAGENRAGTTADAHG